MAGSCSEHRARSSFLVSLLTKLTFVWCWNGSAESMMHAARNVCSARLFNISLIKCSLFIRIPEALYFKSYLRFADLHWLSLMRQPDAMQAGRKEDQQNSIYKLWFPFKKTTAHCCSMCSFISVVCGALMQFPDTSRAWNHLINDKKTTDLESFQTIIFI